MAVKCPHQRSSKEGWSYKSKYRHQKSALFFWVTKVKMQFFGLAFLLYFIKWSDGSGKRSRRRWKFKFITDKYRTVSFLGINKLQYLFGGRPSKIDNLFKQALDHWLLYYVSIGVHDWTIGWNGVYAFYDKITDLNYFIYTLAIFTMPHFNMRKSYSRVKKITWFNLQSSIWI